MTKWDANGSSVSTDQIPSADFDLYKRKTAVVDGDDWFVASHEGMKIYRFHATAIVNETAASYEILSLGMSESFVFCVKYEPTTTSTTTIYKFDRETLALVDTWVISGDAKLAAIHAVSDTDVFIAVEGGSVIRVSNGSVVGNLGATLPATFNAAASALPGWFSVFSDSPPYVVSTSNNPGLNDYIFIGHADNAGAPAKLHDIITDECTLAGIDPSDLDLTELTNHDVRGYKIATLGSARSALEPLQAAFPFDVIQSGYTIKFKDRGAASVVTIPEPVLGAHDADSATPVLLPDSVEMESQVASRVAIQYYDAARDYDIDEQASSNRSSSSSQSRTVNLPIVFTADEALKAADVLLKKEWAERRRFGPFTLPPTYRHIEAADVITVQYKGREITLRLTKSTELQNGLKECEGVLTSSAAYASMAMAQPPLVLGQSLVPLCGTTQAVLLDIPRLTADQDVPGLAAVLYGQASGWPGGVLVSSDDNGGTWNNVISSNTTASVFVASDSLAAHHGYSPDYSGVLTVTPRVAGDDLFSVTEDQFYSEANLAAYGSDGRWEIISFRTATDNSGIFTLQGFIRGLYGSAWASGLHQAGDLLVMLDTASAGFFGLPTNAIGSPRLYRAITQGASIDSAADVSDTYDAVNLKPLAPVDATGNRSQVDAAWTISAVRRSRWPVELFSGQTVPLGETSESYDLELWNSGFTTKYREFSGLASAEGVWTSAMQTSDTGGTANSTIGYRWVQNSSVVGGGFVLQGTLTRVVRINGDNYDNAVLALSPILYYKMDGNTSTVVDSSTSANDGTAGGSVTYQQPALFTGASPGYSIKFNTGYISAPHIAAMNGGYALAFLMKPTALPSGESGFLHKGDAASGGNQGHFYSMLADGTLKCTWYQGGWNSVQTTAPYFSAGAKVHVVLRYNGSNALDIFKDGSLVQTLTLSSAFVNNSMPFIISGSAYSGVSGFSAENTLDDFAWFTTLTDAQILALFEES